MPLQLETERVRGGAAASGGTGASADNGTSGGGGYYRKYILEDLEPWVEHGITKVRGQCYQRSTTSCLQVTMQMRSSCYRTSGGPMLHSQLAFTYLLNEDYDLRL